VFQMGPCGGCDYRLLTEMTFLVLRRTVPGVADGVWVWPGEDLADPVPHWALSGYYWAWKCQPPAKDL
jgi:hypothetical protein